MEEVNSYFIIQRYEQSEDEWYTLEDSDDFCEPERHFQDVRACLRYLKHNGNKGLIYRIVRVIISHEEVNVKMEW